MGISFSQLEVKSKTTTVDGRYDSETTSTVPERLTPTESSIPVPPIITCLYTIHCSAHHHRFCLETFLLERLAD